MDLSIRNSLKHMRNLWTGEVIRKQPSYREQGDCNVQLNKNSFNTAKTDGAEVHVPSALDSASFEFLQGDTTRVKNSLQSPIANVKGRSEQKFDRNSPTTLRRYQFRREMAAIVGTYQHERNENLDEYFKAVGMFKAATENACGVPYDGVPYIPRKMMGMTSPRLEIMNDGDKWTVRTITMMRTVEVTFTLGEEYEEHMPAGVTLKNVTTMEGDSLVTVSVGPDNNKVVRKYELSEDGVVLTMTHEKSGQVAKRYFKRLS